MAVNTYLLLVLAAAVGVIAYLFRKLHRVQFQLMLIQDALADVKAGDLNRRVLARENDLTKQICYDLNDIAIDNQARLVQYKQAQRSYKRLMTSLSHDVKTPLASLIGYLEAIENGLVSGSEKEAYIHVAASKAHRLGEFVTALFEWVKLDAGEQLFHFDVMDINELSRSILADWVPVLENSRLDYDIVIPDTECLLRIDANAYTRILNNLLQNVLVHSGASRLTLGIDEDSEHVVIWMADNGQGIAAEDLPHIFERMYQCDQARSVQGNGLGLAIARELVIAHKGTIKAVSTPGEGTTFTITLPKVW